MGIARLLEEHGQLSRLYTGSSVGAQRFGSMHIVVLNSVRALGAITPLLRKIRNDRADVFLLTANYLALATPLRLARPRSRIVVRVASIVSVEMRDRGVLSRLRYLASSALAFRCANLIITQGREMRDDLVQAFPWAADKTIVIHNFIEEEIWAHEPKNSAAFPYIFCAATFRPVKAFDTLLSAFSRSPARQSRKLVIAGIDRDDQAFSGLMRDVGLSDDDVIRLGFVDKPYDWIANSDLCVLTSRYEGFSNFLLEAAAFGKRLVVTDCPGGNRELLSMYDNNLTVPVDQVDALAQALRSERRDISRKSARSKLTAFEWGTAAASYLKALFPDGSDRRPF